MLLTLALVLANSSPIDPDTSSAMFRGGPQHLGVYPAAKGSYAGIAWRVQTGGPVRSSPVMVQGTVFVGSTDGRVYAIDAARGTIKWRYDARIGRECHPGGGRWRGGWWPRSMGRWAGRTGWTVSSRPSSAQ